MDLLLQEIGAKPQMVKWCSPNRVSAELYQLMAGKDLVLQLLEEDFQTLFLPVLI